MYNERTFNGFGAVKRKAAKKKASRARDEEEEEEKPVRKKFYPHYVDFINEQIKFLRRFKSMAGKTIPVKRLLTFIKGLQKAIHERRIRKGDRYATQIDQAQRFALQNYQRASGVNVEVKIPRAFVESLKEIGKSEKVLPSVSFLKRFVGLVGKSYREVGERLRNLRKNLSYMYEKRIIRENSAYFQKVKEAEKAMDRAIGNRGTLTIPEATLSGLSGIVADETASGFL
jgi:hypothetical protein